jgi:hypothetical protein
MGIFIEQESIIKPLKHKTVFLANIKLFSLPKSKNIMAVTKNQSYSAAVSMITERFMLLVPCHEEPGYSWKIFPSFLASF